MMRFILASKSPRRSFFLKKRGFSFHTFPVEISEILDENLSVESAVEDLALRKAKALVQQGKLEPGYGYVILSADTVVYHRGKVLGKPINEQDAFETLKSLSGQTHQVITAFCLLNTRTNEHLCDHEVSEVTFRPLSDEEILDYVATGDPMDKAGSYGIQSLASQFTGGEPLNTDVVGEVTPAIGATDAAKRRTVSEVASGVKGGVDAVAKTETTFQMKRRDFVVNFTGTLENIAGLPIDKVEQHLREKRWLE